MEFLAYTERNTWNLTIMIKVKGNSELYKKIMIIIFWGSHFMKRSYNIFLVTFIMFKHVKVEKHIVYMGQN